MVLWVFGYGSLIWNPGFDYDVKIIGYIKDYRRVFDLACIDHRGTPEHPARTCTLEAKEGTICWGAAFCVKGGIEEEQAAMKYLEKRECEYDTKLSVDFYKEGDDLAPSVTGVLVRFTCVAWVPKGDGSFIAAHADGNLYVYEKSNDGTADRSFPVIKDPT